MASRSPSPAVAEHLQVLWICGPPGVGKSTVAWAIFTHLRGAETPVAYIDIDQLGMCYPEPAGDPTRNLMKARNLAAAAETFRAQGAEVLVVSGVSRNHGHPRMLAKPSQPTSGGADSTWMTTLCGSA